MMDSYLNELLRRARKAYDEMNAAQKKEHDDAQCTSWVRGMTARCKHGIADFEQCLDCRGWK